jgi:thymidylate synthase
VTSMRANDAYRGLVSDIFSFTLWQEMLAHALDLPVGEYCHRVVSLHTFDSDQASIARVLHESGCRRASVEVFERMPLLLPDVLWSGLKEFWKLHDKSLESNSWRSVRDWGRDAGPWWAWVGETLWDYHSRHQASH